MSIKVAQRKVREFHVKFGVPPFDFMSPGYDWAIMRQRLAWISDEIDEGVQACFAKNEAEMADCWIDIIYFALGGLVEMGIEGAPLFDAVHAANMRKIKLPGVAKIAKPEGWKAPDIAELIAEQRRGR